MARRRFKTLDDLRRYLADALNKLDSGEMNEKEVKTRAYVLNVMAGIIREGELEERVAALEAVLKNPKAGGRGKRLLVQ